MPASTCGGERNRARRRSASDISLLDDIGPRRPCRASAKGHSYALRHEQSERPFVLHRHGLTVTASGLGQGPNRDHDAGRGEPFHPLAKPLSERAGWPPSFRKFTLPVHDRPSICFERLGA
jgi:hypothetical protein